MTRNESNSATHEPSHEELVQHLMRSMEEQGLEIEAAHAPGHPKPKPVKRGLRPERLRPDVVARDGRRTVFGDALLPADIGRGYMPEKLATLAQRCRLLILCVPETASEEAIDTLFNRDEMQHRPKLRLLRHPRTKWEDVPKTAGPTTGRRPDLGPHVVIQR